MSKKLYIVPTPIGNLTDMTIRAIEVLKSVQLVLVEDTRVSKTLLNHFQIETPIEVYHEHNKEEKLPEVLEKLKKKDIAIITDAGTPGISDPGFLLVRAAIDAGIDIIPLPGPTAFVPALVASGLPTDTFTFLGFLGKKSSARKKTLENWKDVQSTLLLYESPYRVIETLEDLRSVLGDRKACVCREISKKYESFYRGTFSELLELFNDQTIAGEVVIVVTGADKQSMVWDSPKVIQALKQEMNSGQSLSKAAKAVAKQSGWKKSEVYELGLKK